MRIGLNLLYLIPGVVGGTETYALGLLAGLKQMKSHCDFVLFLNKESAGLIPDNDPHFQSVVCPVFAENRKNRYFFEQFKLKQYLEQYKIDLLHSLAYTSPIVTPCPAVVSIPDLNFKAFGQSMPLQRRLTLGFIVRQTVLHSRKIITISEFSRQEILKEYNVSPEKIIVTHLAADNQVRQANIHKEAATSDKLSDLPKPYLTTFSSVTTNKNIPRLIEAFLEARKNQQIQQKLVIIGHRCPFDEGKQDPEKRCENQDIVWTGYLDRQKVFDVLKHSDFLVFPSFYEGFGLPALEAMASGVPVVCSHAASLPEVVGDAGIFFDPFSIKDMSEKIAQTAADPALRDSLREKGFRNLERFSWKQTAVQTMAVYKDMMENK